MPRYTKLTMLYHLEYNIIHVYAYILYNVIYVTMQPRRCPRCQSIQGVHSTYILVFTINCLCMTSLLDQAVCVAVKLNKT